MIIGNFSNMIQLIAKPKIILQKSAFWIIAGLVFTLLGCKGTQELSNPDGTESEIELPPEDQFTSEDSLNFLKLLRQKEAAISDYREAHPKDIEVLHVDLDLAFDFQKQSVRGIAKLLISPHFYETKEVFLDAQDFELGRISWINKDSTSKLGYQYDGKVIQIYLPEAVSREDSLWIEINYEAFPERNPTAGSSAITDTKGLYFIDPLDTIPSKPTMIWTQGETEHNSKWFPMVDKPNQRFTQTFALTVPDSMISLSNGVMVKQKNLGNGLRKDYWEMKIPHAPYLAAIGIGNFGKVEDSWKGVPLGYYVEKGYEAGAKKVFENTPLMMEFFSDLLGVDYPWPKYDQLVVKDFVSGAMENTTLSIFMEELKLTEREAIDSEWDYIIAHELFHQWFGDYVTTESWSNLTLNEAFANYSEYLWNEHHYGQDVADLKLVAETENYFYEAETKQVDLIRFEYADSEDMFDSHSYSKGGAILHMLRQVVGDEAFFESLNLYLTQHALQSVEVHDLRLAFEEVTGRDLNWFFNQWFLDKGHPELLIEADYSQPENVLLSVYQTQDLNTTPIYKVPFEVSWYVNGERKVKTLVLERAFQQFALENGDAIDQVYFDEKKHLLALKSPGFTAEQWQKQFMQSQFGVARYEALDSLKAGNERGILLEVLKASLSDPFESVQESGLLAFISGQEWLLENPELEEQIFDLVNTSKNNSVRSTALDVLAANWPDKYYSTFKLLVNDPSYLVAGSALTGLVASSDRKLSEEELAKFELESNYRMIIPLAEYYLVNDVKRKGGWFTEKVESLSGDGMYYFLGYYGEYFSMNPAEGKEEALAFLLGKMKNDPQPGQRLGAFQALLGFADEEEVVEAISRIAAEEDDEFVKAYYDYFLSSLKFEN